MQPEVNYLAILVCGVASMVLGTLWYGPLFGKAWFAESGFDKLTPAQQEAAKKSMMRSYSLAFVGALVMAYVLSHTLTFAMEYMNVSGVLAGLSSGFWMWLGFVAPVTLSSVLWENKSWKMWFITAGYYLLQLLVFGAILAGWR